MFISLTQMSMEVLLSATKECILDVDLEKNNYDSTFDEGAL